MSGQTPEPTFFYRFVRQFEYLIGTYFLPINLFLEAGRMTVTGQSKQFFIVLAFLFFELLMWVLKEQKGEIKKQDHPKLNHMIWLFQIYSICSFLIAMQSLLYYNNFATGSYLLIMSLGFLGKLLLLKRISRQL